MKGLLLKDCYALWSYLRAFLIVEFGFIFAAFFMEMTTFLLLYPCILSGMLSMTLIAYEEKEKWDIYALTLPCSKTQLVSSKYLISLLLGLSVVALSTIAKFVKMFSGGVLDVSAVLSQAALMLPVSLIPTALLLPFIFKFGAEKGRIAYYVLIGVFCAMIALLGGFDAQPLSLPAGAPLNIITLTASLLIYATSWLLSIKFYKSREL